MVYPNTINADSVLATTITADSATNVGILDKALSGRLTDSLLGPLFDATF